MESIGNNPLTDERADIPFPVGSLIERRPAGPRLSIVAWYRQCGGDPSSWWAAVRHLATDRLMIEPVSRETHAGIARAEHGGFGPAVYADDLRKVIG